MPQRKYLFITYLIQYSIESFRHLHRLQGQDHVQNILSVLILVQRQINAIVRQQHVAYFHIVVTQRQREERLPVVTNGVQVRSALHEQAQLLQVGVLVLHGASGGVLLR